MRFTQIEEEVGSPCKQSDGKMFERKLVGIEDEIYNEAKEGEAVDTDILYHL